jgi:hypothetical protein
MGFDHECRKCNGSGLTKRISTTGTRCDCCTNGKVEINKPVEIGAALVSALYLRKIAALPSPLIGAPVDPDAAIAFKFEGGVGYLMPMRKGSS